jgi:hypothetical protein
MARGDGPLRRSSESPGIPIVYPLRSIQFFAELVHAPLTHAPADLQRAHGKLFENDAARYANFQLIQGGAQLSNPVQPPGAAQPQGAVSSAWILPDRVRVQEQLTGVSRDDFERRLDAFARILLDELRIPHFLASQYVVQSLVSPRVAPNAIELVGRSMLALQGDDLALFERPPLLLGVRMTFPTAPVDEGQFHSRIESMQRDPKTIFLENVGVFRAKIEANSLSRIVAQFIQTYDWVQEQLVGYIGRVESRPA